jgi:SAM-dependent methyltransferase
MRLVVALGAVLLAVVTAAAQTREQVEASIAKLPPDERAYERFRYWVTTHPAEVQGNSGPMPAYRAYLKRQGFAEADVDAQVALLTSRNLEAQRWNRILTAENPRFNTNPTAFLVEMAKTLKPGAALDVGMGQGRNAIWLARQGWTVTGFDPADKAVALANENARKLGVRLTTQVAGAEDFDFGENRWDLILLSYVGGREFAAKLERALKPHGIVLAEAFHRDAARGRSIGPAVVFDTGEFVRLFPRLRVVRYEEPLAVADFGQERVRVVRYCGEKVD